jgi:hypothetical protein
MSNSNNRIAICGDACHHGETSPSQSLTFGENACPEGQSLFAIYQEDYCADDPIRLSCWGDAIDMAIFLGCDVCCCTRHAWVDK